jgi:hypothetical protein
MDSVTIYNGIEIDAASSGGTGGDPEELERED